jgi:hypothetical protein
LSNYRGKILFVAKKDNFSRLLQMGKKFSPLNVKIKKETFEMSENFHIFRKMTPLGLKCERRKFDQQIKLWIKFFGLFVENFYFTCVSHSRRRWEDINKILIWHVSKK